MTDAAGRPWSRRRVLGAGLLLAVSACGGTADRGPGDGTDGSSGVTGVTDVDVGCPPAPDAGSCPRRPLAAQLRFVRQDHSRPDVVVRTGEDGTFTVDLPPGRYDVVPDNTTGAPYPRAGPTAVEVRQGVVTTLTVAFDSGVR
jgi:hypothetical protein